MLQLLSLLKGILLCHDTHQFLKFAVYYHHDLHLSIGPLKYQFLRLQIQQDFLQYELYLDHLLVFQ